MNYKFCLATTRWTTNSHTNSITSGYCVAHSFGFGRLWPTVHESNENQNVDSSQSGLENTSLVKDTPIRKSIITI